MKLKELTPEERIVILENGTEHPFTGKYYQFYEKGTYVCKQCGAQLFGSQAKFDSGTGWPSFDRALPGAVREIPEPDGRTEVVCAQCGGHLGHVFRGEEFTPENTRYCVNSLALDFIEAPIGEGMETETAYFAGGCFWGVEYHMEKVPGVISVTSGYMGGHLENPAYEQVCSGQTGHAEVVKVVFDPGQVDYRTLAMEFFNIHDPTQLNRQGPDIGEQYRSSIFYVDEKQKRIARELISELKSKGLDVVTDVVPASTFWKAENYHQDYYKKTGKTPYCHVRTERFG